MDRVGALATLAVQLSEKSSTSVFIKHSITAPRRLWSEPASFSTFVDHNCAFFLREPGCVFPRFPDDTG